MEGFDMGLLMYRKELKRLLAEVGIESGPDEDDTWVLSQVANLIRDPLRQYTYVVEHSPNCDLPYMVRMVGAGKGVIDKLPPRESKDAIGYGETFYEAGNKALEIHQKETRACRECGYHLTYERNRSAGTGGVSRFLAVGAADYPVVVDKCPQCRRELSYASTRPVRD